MDPLADNDNVQAHQSSSPQRYPFELLSEVERSATILASFAVTPVPVLESVEKDATPATTVFTVKAVKSPNAHEPMDNSDEVLDRTLRAMDRTALGHLILHICKTNPAIDGQLKGTLLVHSSEVQEWKENDDQERFNENGNERPILLDEESDKENESPVHLGRFQPRYAICDRCEKRYDTTRNVIGLCKFHPGEFDVSSGFEDDWNAEHRYRQFCHKGYNEDDDADVYEVARENAEHAWDCCGKEEDEEDSFCMVSRHRNVNHIGNSRKRKRSGD